MLTPKSENSPTFYVKIHTFVHIKYIVQEGGLKVNALSEHITNSNLSKVNLIYIEGNRDLLVINTS